MKITAYVGFAVLYFSIGYGQSASGNFSSLSNIVTYLRNVISQTLTLLNLQYTTNPGPVDCAQILKSGTRKSGIYRISPLIWQPIGSFEVYCDMETYGGGWTVIQRRGDYGKPQDYFYKTWTEYRKGFGNLNEDFWLGNDKLWVITNQGNYSLRIDMEDKEGEKRYAFYRKFRIDHENQGYRLHVGDYSGNAGDSLEYHNGMKFTTSDVHNDLFLKNCASLFHGAWWFNTCHLSNLNGLYLKDDHIPYTKGIVWYSWKKYDDSLLFAEMKIRKN
uniref:Ryncolin n=1 Tax=Hadrurus spadix TaxID=141984 RepID=A0A1W7R9M0_9SCOR